MLRLFLKFYFFLFISVFLYLAFGVVSQHTWLNDKIEEDRANDLNGTIYLLNALHESLGSQAFEEQIKNYPTSSNIPIVVLDIDSLNLPPKNEATLKSGQRLTQRDEVHFNSPRNIGIYHYLPGSNLVIKVGPLGRGQELDDMVEFYDHSIFLVIAIPMILIMLSLYIKLKRLESATTQFGSGNLTIRVSEKKRHTIGNLNRHFNRMAERIEQLIKGQKQLRNAVAHELRTPVSRIRFELDMMQMEDNKALRDEYMYGISNDVDELADLVDELLTYARFDREITDLELKPHSLNESLKRVIDTHVFDSKKQFIYNDAWEHQSGILDQIGFDPKLIERAIGNLVGNAEKYAHETIHLHMKQENFYTTIYVDDDGPGVPDSERIDIFTPFKRLDTSRTRATGGFGLGLSIVKQIAQWHGGDASVETSPLGGARFVFSWPT
ncbi:Sensor protein RstB [BD1-7 clade bacterium]|uniref:histidine kinase n=1 Tax=BD1-7 clade bacterium TaxID=2029982 RepID=A0A5S9PST5_9GAMM|nr:Sensor protein RstB [BD1-7 clade bacterium]